MEVSKRALAGCCGDGAVPKKQKKEGVLFETRREEGFFEQKTRCFACVGQICKKVFSVDAEYLFESIFFPKVGERDFFIKMGFSYFF